MSSGTKTPGVQIVLPGNWWKIPVGDEEAATRSIRALAEKITNRIDEFAQLRRDLRTELTQLAEKAREGGADQLFLALEIVPGAPLPMSLALFWPDIDVLGSTPSEPASVIALVRAALEDGPDAAMYSHQEQASLGGTETWRRAHTIEHPAEGDVEAYETFVVDYWVAVPGVQRVALITFSTTVPGERELLLQLFRVMIESMRWDRESDGT